MNAVTQTDAKTTRSFGPEILHPTDFGPDQRLACAHAVALALKLHARLTLLHIRGVDDSGPTRNGLGPVADLLVRWGRLKEADRFGDFGRALGFSASCLDVPARSVGAGVLAHFDEHPVELSVLTTRPQSGLAYWFAGSVSRRALRQADAMILFIREGQRGFVDLRDGAITLRRALVPVDGRIPANVAIGRAKRLLDSLSASTELRLMHVGDAPPQNAPKDIPVMLAQGPVAEAILRAAHAFKSDLIIMPTLGKRGVLAAFRNSVSARILDDARWPVLSVPALDPRSPFP